MRAVASLIGKDVREHGLTALVLAAATVIVVLVALGQNRAAAFSMSPFEVVRFALLTYVPLVSLIVGNRLVVREYLAGTRLFVEALPVGGTWPLVLKYLLGAGYLTVLVAVLVLLAARAAGLADDATPAYVLSLGGKALVVALLYWSVVFCFSLCGHLRVILYLATIGLVLFVAWWPGIDQTRFSPFALLDAQLFVFERDLLPWRDILGTLALAAAFTIAGFALSRVGEGSVAERLAKPMTRRDHAALGVLLVGGAIVASVLVDRRERESIAFTSEATLRSSVPPVSVFHVDGSYRASAERRLARTVESIAELQAVLGVTSVPVVRLSLAPELEPHDVQYSTLDDVLVRANWLAHDDFDDAVLDAVVLHGVLGSLSGERAMFEPYHWVLDGLSRWWAERSHEGARDAHEAELLARAIFTLARAEGSDDLIDDWQLLADRFAYPSAEAIAWSAMRYLEIERGEETVLTLARAFFGEALGGNSLDALRDRRRPTRMRFAEATGTAWDTFVADWRDWLAERAADPAVRALLDGTPPLTGTLAAGFDDAGVHRLVGGYRPVAGINGRAAAEALSRAVADSPALRCVMKHDVLGPFDNEFDVDQGRDPRTRDVADCGLGDAIHDVGSRYAPGLRVYVGFDLENGTFHQPLRLGAVRLDLEDAALAPVSARGDIDDAAAASATPR